MTAPTRDDPSYDLDDVGTSAEFFGAAKTGVGLDSAGEFGPFPGYGLMGAVVQPSKSDLERD